MDLDVLVIGGGAAGFFSALSAKTHHPEAKIAILEKTAKLLTKVKISGGGRCNVTHHCFDPKELVKNYPRGHKELLGPFYTFGPKETIQWFLDRGVDLHVEQDGRMFPDSNDSQTIIDCFLSETKKLGIPILVQKKIMTIDKNDDMFFIQLKDNEILKAKKLILATGSNSFGYDIAKKFSHKIQDPIPSLFTFNIESFELAPLSGLSLQEAKVSLEKTSHSMSAPLLITHFGLSGPCVLKLSAFAAKTLYEKNYTAKVKVNWLGSMHEDCCYEQLVTLKNSESKKTLWALNPFSFPKRLWKFFLEKLEISEKKLSQIPLKHLKYLSQKLCQDTYQIKGKTTNKEEFVTCGGVSLNEVNFKTMESKKCSGLFFTGEILDIDGITGGFNFQNAWTTGFLAGKNLFS